MARATKKVVSEETHLPVTKKTRYGTFTFKGVNCVGIFETEEMWDFANMKFLDLKEIKDLKKVPSEVCIYEGELTPETFLSKDKVKIR